MIRKDSEIEHHEAGQGIFLDSETPVLPGTLLGFYPGVIMNKMDEKRFHETDIKPFMVRDDGYWVNHEYGIPNTDKRFSVEHFSEVESFKKMIKAKSEREENPIDPIAINPYAIGHLLNHPPPDVSENIVFVDFDIPYTWFPTSFSKFIPYADVRDVDLKKQTAWKTIAVVSNRIIHPGEEIYANYL